MYAMMDNDTRFWKAQQVADTKYMADTTPLIKAGRKAPEKVPDTLTTDGIFNFGSAFRTAYRSESEALMTQHIRHLRMQGDRNNNPMERFNGELRDREKITRNLKKPMRGFFQKCKYSTTTCDHTKRQIARHKRKQLEYRSTDKTIGSR